MTTTDREHHPCGCGTGCGEGDTRRGFLAKAAAAAAAAKLFFAGSAARAQDEAAASPPQPGDRLTYQAQTRRGPLLTLDDIDMAGRQVMALPVDPATGTVRDGSRFNQVMLTRFDPAELDEQTRGRAAEGVVAYSAICTHDGCAVSSWHSGNQQYVCPCHQSFFDPKVGGALVRGPAYRPLPALPLAVENGELVVAAAFTARVGGGR